MYASASPTDARSPLPKSKLWERISAEEQRARRAEKKRQMRIKESAMQYTNNTELLRKRKAIHDSIARTSHDAAQRRLRAHRKQMAERERQVRKRAEHEAMQLRKELEIMEAERAERREREKRERDEAIKRRHAAFERERNQRKAWMRRLRNEEVEAAKSRREPLYKRMEAAFFQNVQGAEETQRKSVLEERRDQQSTPRVEDLEAFNEKFVKTISLPTVSPSVMRKKRLLAREVRKRVVEAHKTHRNASAAALEAKKMMRKRAMEYSKRVKDAFAPELDPAKREEALAFRSKAHHEPRKPKTREEIMALADEQKVRRKPRRYPHRKLVPSARPPPEAQPHPPQAKAPIPVSFRRDAEAAAKRRRSPRTKLTLKELREKSAHMSDAVASTAARLESAVSPEEAIKMSGMYASAMKTKLELMSKEAA